MAKQEQQQQKSELEKRVDAQYEQAMNKIRQEQNNTVHRLPNAGHRLFNSLHRLYRTLHLNGYVQKSHKYLDSYKLILEGSMEHKYGFWQRRKNKRQLKKAISNNVGRMMQICDSLVGSQELALSVATSSLFVLRLSARIFT